MLGSYEELRHTRRLIDVAQLPQSSDGAFHPNLQALWIEGYDLLQQELVWLPFGPRRMTSGRSQLRLGEAADSDGRSGRRRRGRSCLSFRPGEARAQCLPRVPIRLLAMRLPRGFHAPSALEGEAGASEQLSAPEGGLFDESTPNWMGRDLMCEHPLWNGLRV
jgi:hypothetical protein